MRTTAPLSGTAPDTPGSAASLGGEHKTGQPSSCPACGTQGAEVIYSLAEIPVQSAILLNSAEEAEAYPTGALELAWCTHCGLAFNSRFDSGKVRYGHGYEESQGASPTFRRFALGLSERWIERYALHGKPALEIGCGKGEFLDLYCTLSGGTGVGFDPAWVPERQREDRLGAVSFHREFFDERHVPFDADIIICRHTLEHVQDVRAFVRLLRAACGARRSTIIAVEVPDLKRILDECAFWDIYYEHASYFTAGALARLFQREDFEILALDRVYGDQYLVLEARPASGGSPPRLPVTDDLPDTRTAISAFRNSVAAAISDWQSRLKSWHIAGETVALWGSGSKAVGFLTTIGAGDKVAAVVDINQVRQGRFMPGVGAPIVAPRDLPSLAPDHVIIMNPIYKEEIRAELVTLGLSPSIHTTAMDPGQTRIPV